MTSHLSVLGLAATCSRWSNVYRMQVGDYPHLSHLHHVGTHRTSTLWCESREITYLLGILDLSERRKEPGLGLESGIVKYLVKSQLNFWERWIAYHQRCYGAGLQIGQLFNHICDLDREFKVKIGSLRGQITNLGNQKTSKKPIFLSCELKLGILMDLLCSENVDQGNSSYGQQFGCKN